jgi:hypothetical protein
MNNYYYDIIEKNLKSSKNNDNFLFFIEYYYNPLDDFNHIIKKKSLHLYLIISDKNIYNKLSKNIKDEENEHLIHLYNNIDEFIIEKCSDKLILKIDYIVLFNLDSLSYLENILSNLYKIINIDTNIYIYCNLSNEKIEKINYKNIIRNNIKKYIGLNINNLFSLHDIINSIQISKYKINNISVYTKNTYILYGDNKVYKLLLSKRFT